MRTLGPGHFLRVGLAGNRTTLALLWKAETSQEGEAEDSVLLGLLCLFIYYLVETGFLCVAPVEFPL